jgi:hypothetical protein
MLVKSKWTKEIIDRLMSLPFVIDVELKEKRYETSDWFVMIKLKDFSIEYRKPILKIINDIENEILKEDNEFVGIDFDWEEIIDD